DPTLESCDLHQHGVAVDVAGGEDVVDLGAQVVIYGDVVAGVGDAGGAQGETLDVARPAHRREHGVDRRPPGRSGAVLDFDPVAHASQAQDHGGGVRIDALAHKGALELGA